MEKTLVFDLDGTIVNLYGYCNWLELLRSENALPYEQAEPLYDMVALNSTLCALKEKGWRIVVVSWLSKESSADYDKAVRRAKIGWLDKYEFPYDEIHLVKYGTTKASCVRNISGLKILIDDNERIRRGWDNGVDRISIDANADVIDTLRLILSLEG
jgi:hypothetical protein